MANAREIMDVYLGSSAEEQFDLWFSNRDLRTQFDAVEHIAQQREGLPSSPGKNAPSGGRQGFRGKLTGCHPWPARV